MKQTIAIWIALLFITACADGLDSVKEFASYDENTSTESVVATQTVPQQQALDIQEQAGLQKKKIIKDGKMGIEVKNLTQTKQRVDSIVKLYQGYYSSDQYSNNYSGPGYNMTIRVLSKNYEALIAGIEEGKGKILYKNTSARDVTEQYLDTEIRLANKRTVLNRYRELVKQAKTIKEILEIEEPIRRLEEEIESAQGRLRYINDQVAYSTLELTITTHRESVSTPEDSFWSKLKEALSEGWSIFTGFVLALLYIWPFWLILLLVGYLIYRRKKKNKMKK